MVKRGNRRPLGKAGRPILIMIVNAALPKKVPQLGDFHRSQLLAANGHEIVIHKALYSTSFGRALLCAGLISLWVGWFFFH